MNMMNWFKLKRNIGFLQESPEAKERKAAAHLLGELGDKRSVEPLIKALGDSHCEVRCAAAEALGSLGDPRSVESLIQLLVDSPCAAAEAQQAKLADAHSAEMLIRTLERRSAGEALGMLGDKRAVEPLVKALGDGDSLVRRIAAEALGKVGDSRSIEPLMQALGDGERMVRPAAAEALAKLGQPQWTQWIKGDGGDFDRLGSNGGKRAVEPLIQALRSPIPDERRAAAKMLGNLGDNCAVEPLIRALGQLEGPAAVEALAKLPGAHTVELLIKALGDIHYARRQGAAEVLGNLDDSRAVEPLIKLLGAEDYVERLTAAEALAKLGQPQWKQSVKGDDHDFERLGSSGDKQVIAPLIRALANFRPDTRREAAKALARLGQGQWCNWVRGDDHDFERLGNSGDKCAVEPLIQALGAANSEVRRTAAQGLGKLSDARAVEPLVQALEFAQARESNRGLKDPESSVRRAAEEALTKLPRPIL